MQAWARYLICGWPGSALGTGAAVLSVRAGAWGSSASIAPGRPPRTSHDPCLRLHAPSSPPRLLAFRPVRHAITAPMRRPRRSARWTLPHRIAGGDRARLFSVTLYNNAGFLVPTSAYLLHGSAGMSAGIAAPGPSSRRQRQFGVGAHRRHRALQPTLRNYLPADGARATFPARSSAHRKRAARNARWLFRSLPVSFSRCGYTRPSRTPASSWARRSSGSRRRAASIEAHAPLRGRAADCVRPSPISLIRVPVRSGGGPLHRGGARPAPFGRCPCSTTAPMSPTSATTATAAAGRSAWHSCGPGQNAPPGWRRPLARPRCRLVHLA